MIAGKRGENMTRTRGAVGKTETKRQLREKIAALEENLDEWRLRRGSREKPMPETTAPVTEKTHSDNTGEGDSESSGEVPGAPRVLAGTITSLEFAPPEADTYVCGRCKGKLSSAVSQCPHCGEMLTWT